MPQAEIRNAMEPEALMQKVGFLPFFTCAVPDFSIEEFTPSRYWFVDGADGPWEWRMELARRGVPLLPLIGFDWRKISRCWAYFPFFKQGQNVIP